MQRFRPQLTVLLPEGWFAKESITLLAPDGQANLIASSEPLDPSISAQRYAEVQGELLRKEFPGYREFTFEQAQILSGRRGYIRLFEWTPPDGVPVTQVQLYYAENSRGYTATATTPTSEYDRFKSQLHQLLNALMIEA